MPSFVAASGVQKSVAATLRGVASDGKTRQKRHFAFRHKGLNRQFASLCAFCTRLINALAAKTRHPAPCISVALPRRGACGVAWGWCARRMARYAPIDEVN